MGISGAMATISPITTVPDAADPFALTISAWRQAKAGNHDDALVLLRQALTRAPGDPVALTTLGSVYREMGRLRDAVLSCDAAIAVVRGHAPAWLERGFVMAAGGSINSAYECYAQAAKLDPAIAAAHAGMASIAARRGDVDAARFHAQTALTLEPENVIATCALATVEIEGGFPQAAATRLTHLIGNGKDASAERAVAFNLLGDAHDRIGNADAAFAAYARGKAIFANVHAPLMDTRPQTQREFIEMIAESLDRVDDTSGWAIPDEGTAPRHVFLLGYPRSGTTLVENILASLPVTTALEERPTLGDADRAFLVDTDGMNRLAALDSNGSKQYREAYWAKVAAAGATPPPNGTFVDMDPLKATRLPIISRLFPHARILIMRRDPRDVVWSCFHTNFALTNATYEYTDLERTARHYDAMMRLTELCLSKLPLNTHIIRYDRIVRDFDAETKRLCGFVGVPWSEDLHHFNRTALARGVATASAAQVRKPLYDGTRQWKRYAKYLAPVMPLLRPWIDKFGFEA
jgi:tetratricopeptide (TPR) repeat protein